MNLAVVALKPCGNGMAIEDEVHTDGGGRRPSPTHLAPRTTNLKRSAHPAEMGEASAVVERQGVPKTVAENATLTVPGGAAEERTARARAEIGAR